MELAAAETESVEPQQVLTTTTSELSTGETTPTGRKTPVKPALKTSDTITDEEDNAMKEEQEEGSKKKSSKKKKKKNNRTLKWDEAKIQEHDQLRGTRMKIDEPNTPYAHYDSGSETDGSLSSARGNNNKSNQISWDALTNKLEAHAAVKDQIYPPSSPSSHGGQPTSGHTTDEEGYNSNSIETEEQRREGQRSEMKRLEFQEHRKRHYNEMEVVRRFRRDHPDGVPTLNGQDHDHGDAHEDEDDENDGDDENE